MKIASNTKLRIFVLSFALVALGGATTGMFFAASQNESVLASETDGELIALTESCGAGKKWDSKKNKCIPQCSDDEFLNDLDQCQKISTDIPVKSVALDSDKFLAEVKYEDLSDLVVPVPGYNYQPSNATNANFLWKSSNSDIISVINYDNGGVAFNAKGFGTVILTLYLESDESIHQDYVVTLKQNTTCPNSDEVWESNVDNGIDYGRCRKQTPCDNNTEGYEYDKNGECVKKCGENQHLVGNSVCECDDGYEQKNDSVCTLKPIKTQSVSIIPDAASSVFELNEELTLNDFLGRLSAKVVFNPTNAADTDSFRWSSDDPSIIEVYYKNDLDSPTFIIKGFGTANLTISKGDIVSNNFSVTTTKAYVDLKEIKLDSGDLSAIVDRSDLGKIDISDKIDLPTPIFVPEDATDVNASWESSNNNILIATKICSATDSYDAITAEQLENLSVSILNGTYTETECNGVLLPVFIPTGYGETTIYVTDGTIKSNKIKIEIKEGSGKDTDGDGIPDDQDDDIDGDGYLNEDDINPDSYDVAERDLLMFATLVYDAADSAIDRIAGNTVTGNGKTVSENYYEKNGKEAYLEYADNGYGKYFSYICPDRVSNKQADKNECMYDEDQLIGMQAQDYSSLDGLIQAWQTTGKDYYFGGSSEVSISEVNQWVITDHVSQRVTLSKREGRMEATTFRLNNNIVIAYRGTDFTDLMEWMKDLTFVTGGISGYENAAKSYAQNIFGQYAEEYYKDEEAYIAKYGGAPKFYITGHSLGGYLSQIGALGMIESNAKGLEFLQDVIYFNGMGIGFFGGQRARDYNTLFDWASQTNEAGSLIHNITCYHINGDPVSALGRHVNEVGYYASASAINRHATQNVSKFQSWTRNKLADGFVEALTHVVGKAGELGAVNTSRLDDVKDYLDYYSKIYGDNFKGIFNDGGTISVLDLMWFCHEPSASLFYNIKKGVNGHSELKQSDEKITSRDYLKTVTYVNDGADDENKDWYGELVNVTRYDDDDKVILTAQVTGDAKNYTWYKNGQEVGTNNTLTLNKNESGSVYVEATVTSRRGNSRPVITLSTEDSPVVLEDKSAPSVTITAINDIWRAKTDSKIVLKVTAKSPSGFSKATIDANNDISISSLTKKKIAIDAVERVDAECNDQTEVWNITLKATGATTFTLQVEDGAFVSNNSVKSGSARSKVATFTALTNEQDHSGPKIAISAIDGDETEKGNELRFQVTVTDEGGIKEDRFENHISVEPALAKLDYRIEGEPVQNNNKTQISYLVIVSCYDSTKLDVSGQLYVKHGAFIDNNGNLSLAEASSTFKFTTPADKTAPITRIDTVDKSNKTTYGGTIVYDVVVSDDSGLDTNSPLTADNILVSPHNPWIEIIDISGPTYNNDNSVASYKVTLTSNDQCSNVLGCGGVFYVAKSATKDIYGNENIVDRISPMVVFASEIDHISPAVKIDPVAGRKAELGGTINFKVTASDNSGIDQSVVLTKNDFEVLGSKGNVTVESVSEPSYSDSGRKVSYIVTVKGNEVSTGAYLNLPAGKVKDNNGNYNILSHGEVMIFTKPIDLSAPKVRFEPASSWSTEAGTNMVVKVIITDNDELKANQTLKKSDFIWLDGIVNDLNVVGISEPKYESKSVVVYDITITATKSGNGYLQLKFGAISDISNNVNLLTSSQKITFTNPNVKDTKRPKVDIKPVNGWTAKAGNELKLRVVVTDDVALENPSLELSDILKSGSKDINVESVNPEYQSNKEASWIVTLTCNKKSFGFLELIKSAGINVEEGTFKDTAGNESRKETITDVFSFTR